MAHQSARVGTANRAMLPSLPAPHDVEEARVGERVDERGPLQQGDGHRSLGEDALEPGPLEGGIHERRMLARQQLRLLLAQPHRPLLELPVLLEERHEEPHLGPHHLRVEGLGDIVHRPLHVAPDDGGLVLVHRGHEDDGRAPVPLPLPDEPGGLEAIHSRHHRVQEDDGEVLPEQTSERLLAGDGLHHGHPERRQYGLQRDEVGGVVVHQQHAGSGAQPGHLQNPRGSARCRRPRRTPASGRSRESRPCNPSRAEA
jgi:hypothetical protein